MMNARVDGLFDRGVAASNEGRLRDAAALLERAAKAAEQGGDRARAIHIEIMTASIWENANEPVRALEHFTAILPRLTADLPTALRFRGKERLWLLKYEWLPDFGELSELLEELRTLNEYGRGAFSSDVHVHQAHFLWMQGRVEDALRQIEMAWSKRGRSDGISEAYILYTASKIAIELGLRGESARWLEILASIQSGTPYKRTFYAVAMARLALCSGDSVAGHRHVAAAYKECPKDAVSLLAEIQEVRVRVALRWSENLDPVSPQHSARQQIAQRLGRLGATEKMDWLVLKGDYRMSCLRFAAGIEPVDDRWESLKEAVERIRNPMSVGEIEVRSLRAQRAYSRAMAHAKFLDSCFATAYHTKKIERRLKMLEQIQKSFTLDTHL